MYRERKEKESEMKRRADADGGGFKRTAEEDMQPAIILIVEGGRRNEMQWLPRGKGGGKTVKGKRVGTNSTYV